MKSYCPTCNAECAESEDFCPHDGTRLERRPSRPSQTKPSGAVVARAPRTVPLATKDIELVSMTHALSIATTRPKQQHLPNTSPHQRLIGTVLDERYRIERKIGEGGMGVVFLARHVVIEKPVAVKVLKSQPGRNRNVVTRFVQEARSASRIGHPGIVDVTDFGTTPDGMTYSVMEYVDGETLQQVIKSAGRLSVARAVPIVAQIAQALSAAHEKGIVHRDLKPDNVFLLSRDGRPDLVKVGDFGIAKVTSLDDMPEAPRLTHAGTIFGTPEYMAPEQAAGQMDVDHLVDIYSLGIIFYEALTGRLPHNGETMLRTLVMQILEPVTPPREAHPGLSISDELEALIMKALAKKREQRFQSMKALLEELKQAAGDIPLTVAPVLHRRALSTTAATPGARTLIPDPTHADSLELTTEVPAMPPGPTAAWPAQSPVQAIEQPLTGDDGATTGNASLEPAFLQRKKPPTLEVFQVAPTQHRRRRKRTPWVLAAVVVLLAGGSSGIVAALLGKRATEQPPEPARATASASRTPTDAGLTASTGVLADAAPAFITTHAPGAVDAAGPAWPVEPGSAPSPGKETGRRPTSSEHPPELPVLPAPNAVHEILLVTEPEGANIYINGTYAGHDGTRLARMLGTSVTLECRLPGYQPGRITVTFDSDTEVSLCRLRPLSRCVAGFKNPFGDCPEPEPAPRVAE